MSKNYFNNLVDAGVIKVKQRTPEWAKELLNEEVLYIEKLQKMDSILNALRLHFTKKFEREFFKGLFE